MPTAETAKVFDVTHDTSGKVPVGFSVIALAAHRFTVIVLVAANTRATIEILFTEKLAVA